MYQTRMSILLHVLAVPELHINTVCWPLLHGYRIRIYFRELLEIHSADFNFRGSGRSNLQFFYLAHILCSYTRQYECDDVVDGFWGPGDGCRLHTGSEAVPGQIFASINFRGLGFIRKKNCTPRK